MAIELRSNVLERIQRLSGLQTDDAMAGAIGVSVETYRRVKNGKQYPSLKFIDGVGRAFNFQIGELVRITPTEPAPAKTAA